MPGAIQLPVNQKSLPRSKKRKMVTTKRVIDNGCDYKVTSPIEVVSTTPGNPENLDDLISKELSSRQIQRPIQ
ncbi:hypothetical protein GLOIN_2v1782186 [Rhizophagus irregularis DAOM 181602=DAOM 197198]|uniref:Uncharacterized protein n=2 Tax=Rhizophagus irregularis TaxID=588596 RepID=A0A015LY27_RHIIW|nr:hypothetical protein RirG_022410 [Rhizophagus irregularis DAOM 197198w]GET62733.1 hypothetical protein GLOIN_2v1782186 [Rhizophagus irregularis DAOM 181602=DAOM 197198]